MWHNFFISCFRKYVFFFFCLCIFGTISSCEDAYRDHYIRENSSIYTQNNSGSITGALFILPDKTKIQTIVETIKNAKKRIWIEIYTWTEKETLQAVLEAKKRGVDVRVILERNVYGFPRMNDPHFHTLLEAHIPVVYSNPEYTFTHAKFWIIDAQFCISTGNWSYTSFTKNREFFFCSENASIRKNLKEIFLSDYDYKTVYFSSWIHQNLALSPENMRPWLLSELQKTKKSLLVMNQSIEDPEMIRNFSLLQKRGVDVRICTIDRSTSTGEVQQQSEAQYRSWISLLYAYKPYLHAKLFLIDDTDLLIGSTNMTSNALDNNREVFIKISPSMKEKENIRNIFHRDCKEKKYQ